MAGAWEVGARLGELVLGEQVGAGGMGRVHAATHVGTGAVYAVKVLDPGAGPALRERFRREGEAQARVDGHPNVVRVHGAGDHAGCPYLVMDLARGGDLSQRLEGGPMEPRAAVDLVVALAAGLEHVHAAGVLHRDLKPANILFDEQGTPKLVDFGLARLEGAETLTQTGAVLGTPAYMAPEQADASRAEVGPATDVYGLGAILYHALTGRPPFQGATPVNVLNAVLTKPPRPPRELRPEVPRGVSAVCLRALAKEVRRRPPSCAAFAEELSRALATRGPARAPLVFGVCAAALLALTAWGLAPAARDSASAPPPAVPGPTPPAAAPEAPAEVAVAHPQLLSPAPLYAPASDVASLRAIRDPWERNRAAARWLLAAEAPRGDVELIRDGALADPLPALLEIEGYWAKFLDHRRILVAREGRPLFTVDVATEERAPFPRSGNWFALSRDRQRVVLLGDGRATVTDPSGQVLREEPLGRGDIDPIICAIADDGARIACATDDRQAAQRFGVAVLGVGWTACKGRVLGIAFAGGSLYAAGGEAGGDGVDLGQSIGWIRRLDPDTAEVLQHRPLEQRATALAVGPGGDALVVALGLGGHRLYSLPDLEPVEGPLRGAIDMSGAGRTVTRSLGVGPEGARIFCAANKREQRRGELFVRYLKSERTVVVRSAPYETVSVSTDGRLLVGRRLGEHVLEVFYAPW